MAIPFFPIALMTNALSNVVGHVMGHKRGTKQSETNLALHKEKSNEALALQNKRDTATLALHKEQADSAMRLQDKRDAEAYKLAILQVKSQAELKKIDLEFQAWARERQWGEDRWRTEYVENMRAIIQREQMAVNVWQTEENIKLQKWKTLRERETALELKLLDAEIALMVAAHKRESDLVLLQRRYEQDHQPIWLTVRQFLSGNNLTALRILVSPPDKELNESFPVAPIIDDDLTRIGQYYSTHGRPIQFFDRNIWNNVNNAQQTVAKVLHADLSSIPVLVLNGQLAGFQFLVQYSFWGSNWNDIISDGLVKFDVKSNSNYYACERVKQWQEARAKAENPQEIDEIYGEKEVERLSHNLKLMNLEVKAKEMGIDSEEPEYRLCKVESKKTSNYLRFLFSVNTAVCADLYFLSYAPMPLPLKPLMFECFHELNMWEGFTKEEISEIVKGVLASYTKALEGLTNQGEGVLVPELYLQLSESMYQLKFYELSRELVVASVTNWLRQRSVPPSGDLINLLKLMRDFITSSDRSYILLLQQCLRNLGVDSYIEDIVPFLNLMAEQEERQREEQEEKQRQEAEARRQQEEKERQEKQRNRLTETVKGVEFKVVEILAGELIMGGNHRISIKSFLLGETPVTNAQWKAVMGTNPSNQYGSNFTGDNNPVVGVSWHEAGQFCTQLSSEIGRKVRLPSEAEWEYAARAGTTTKYFFGDNDGQLSQYAWYNNNDGQHTKPVKGKNSNKWNLYDILGNVWEWCQDNYTSNITEIPVDGSPCTSRTYRSLRGGAWLNLADYCACGYRLSHDAGLRLFLIGFRVVFAPRTL